MSCQRLNVSIFLFFLLAVTAVNASHQITKSQSPSQDEDPIKASSNVKIGPGLHSNIQGILAKNSPPKSKGLIEVGDSSDEVPPIKSEDFVKFPIPDSMTYNDFKKLNYNSFCRPLGPSAPTDLNELLKSELQDGAAPCNDKVAGNTLYFKRESIASLYSDAFCNFYLGNQIDYFRENRKSESLIFDRPQGTRDDLGSFQKTTDKTGENGKLKLTFHKGIGYYYDSVCNWYANPEQPNSVFKDIALQLAEAITQKKAPLLAKRTPTGSTVVKIHGTDFWVDQQTCDLLIDAEVAFYEQENGSSSKEISHQALIRI